VNKSSNDVERRILAVLQEGLPRSRTPFADLARAVGIGTGELLAVLERWKQDGTLRRIGAMVDHLRVGVSEGAMVVWKVAPERTEEVGAIFARCEEVSHAYERETPPGWEYNVYTMVHGPTRAEVRRAVERMSWAAGVAEYEILWTVRELKKVSPRYVDPAE
jgi:DNA-binding Lrp family transcriptional regulator